MPIAFIITGSTEFAGRTIYSISVTSEGAQWVINKRFKDFVNLDAQLAQVRGISRLELPEKGTFGIRHALNIGDFNEKRQQSLQQYLTHLASQVQSLNQVQAIAQWCAVPAQHASSSQAGPVSVEQSALPVYMRQAQEEPVKAQVVPAQPVLATVVPQAQEQPVKSLVVPAQPVLATVVTAVAPTSGSDAPMTISGYQDVQNLNNSFEMAIFMRRLIEAAGGRVQNESDLMDVAPLFSGETAKQAFDRLWEELAKRKWTPGGMGASFSPEGYCSVAARRSNMEMQAYIRRLITAADGKLVGEQGNANLIELVPFHSGDKAVQSFRDLCQQLQKKAQTEGWLEFNMQALPPAALAAAEGVEESTAASPVQAATPVRQPSCVQPVMAQPVTAVAQPVMTAQPGMGQPVMAQPLMTAQPGMSQPVMAQPVMAQPVMAQPVMAQPVMAQPVMAQPVASQPVMNPPWQGTGQPGGVLAPVLGAATAAMASMGQGGLGRNQRW